MHAKQASETIVCTPTNIPKEPHLHDLGFVVVGGGCKLAQQQRRLPLALRALAAQQPNDWLQRALLLRQQIGAQSGTGKHNVECRRAALQPWRQANTV